MTVPRRVAVLGAGEIGSGWAALFAAFGAEVALVDPAARSVERAHRSLAIARELGIGTGDAGRIVAAGAAAAVRDAEWVQESLPEDLDVKRAALAELADDLPPRAIVASSTSTLTAGDIAHGLPFADRVLVAHPLHPVYAVPVVELSASRHTAPDVVPRAGAVMRALDREPIVVHGEPPGLVANRLCAAMLREAEALVARGAVSQVEVDRIVAHGTGTGWLIAGPFRTEAMGRGAGGMSEREWARAIAAVLRAARVAGEPAAE
jgi:3-hydroxyacyl-CoA dehydrogenase